MFDIKKPSEINIPEFDSIEKKESTMSRSDIMDAVSFGYTALHGQIQETEDEFIYTRLAKYVNDKYEMRISKKELHSAVMILDILKEIFGSDIEPMVNLLNTVKEAYLNGYSDGIKESSNTLTDYLSYQKKGQE